jgi:hypothetical protein
MPEANYQVGENFQVQFVWRIPNDDFLRAIFRAEVLLIDDISDKYVIRLTDFISGRQEAPDGSMRSLEEVARDYWALVNQLKGRKISLAFEADDGRPLWLRLETLTGEHNFFRRLNELPPQFRDWQVDK